MLIHPQFDPIALQLGPLAIHWYGLMYLAGFITFLWLGRKRITALNDPQINAKLLDDLLFYGVLGVILGGRLGYVLFYKAAYYFAHPLEVFAVWQGGMSLSWRLSRRAGCHGLVRAQTSTALVAIDRLHRPPGAARPGVWTPRQFHQR